MSFFFVLLLCHPLLFLCLELFLSFMILLSTSVSNFIFKTLSSRCCSYPWTESALLALLLLSVVFSLNFKLPELLLLLLVFQLHPLDRIFVNSMKSSLILGVDFILDRVPAIFISFECTVFVNCQSMSGFGVYHFVVQIFVHPFFLEIAVIRHSIHFASHEEVWFLFIDAWLVPVCSTTVSCAFWVVHNCFISVFESCWLSFTTLLSRCTSSWSNILFFIEIIFLVSFIVGILTEVVISIVISMCWSLCLRVWVLWASLRLRYLIASSWWTSSLSLSTSRSHSIWRLQLPTFRLLIWIMLPLSMAARNVLTLSQFAISFINIVVLLSIWREVVPINIKIDWLIILKLLLILIIGSDSTLSALLSRSTKGDLWWHHPVLNHIVSFRLWCAHLLVIILVVGIVLHATSCLWSSASSISTGIWVWLAVAAIVLIISIDLILPHNVFVINFRF